MIRFHRFFGFLEGWGVVFSEYFAMVLLLKRGMSSGGGGEGARPPACKNGFAMEDSRMRCFLTVATVFGLAISLLAHVGAAEKSPDSPASPANLADAVRPWKGHFDAKRFAEAKTATRAYLEKSVEYVGSLLPEGSEASTYWRKSLRFDELQSAITSGKQPDLKESTDSMPPCATHSAQRIGSQPQFRRTSE